MKSILSKEINKASGSYNVTLGNIDGYIIKEQNPSDGKISINYDNPVGEYICTLSKAKEIVIIHGIFNDESREITENTYSDPYLLNKNDIVTCAAEITGLTGNNNTIKLNIDTNIIDISNIRVLDENLNPINSLTYNTNNNEFIWNNFNSNNNQKIIIIYTVKLSDNYTGIYRNTISVNEDNEKSVYIKFDNNKYLPDLF